MRKLFAGALAGASLLAVSAPVMADAGQDLPAVSGTNENLSLVTGIVSNKSGIASIGGDIATPLSHSVGLQVDAALGYTKDQIHGGASGQVFWRNPAQGLFGVYGSYSFVRDINGSYFGNDRTFAVARGGVNAAVYQNRVTLEGIGGVEGGSVNTRFFDSVDLAYYPEDNFKLSVGHRLSHSDHYANVSAEYLLNSSSPLAPSLFVDASYSSPHLKALLMGVRLRFGAAGGKSLIRRDREDDPSTLLHFDQSVLTTCQTSGVVPSVRPMYAETGCGGIPIMP